MNEVKIVFSDNEMTSHLRELGATVEHRKVEKWAMNESYNAWVWQVQTSNGEWRDALPVYRQLLQTSIRRSLIGSVNVFDLLNIIK